VADTAINAPSLYNQLSANQYGKTRCEILGTRQF
jgi:hypothetical protein